jgi:hypothetical protein
LTRITFSTPVTPARERLTCVAGTDACTSGAESEGVIVVRVATAYGE